MKQQLNHTLLLLTLFSVLILGCKKEASIPTVTTTEVTEVTQNTAKSGGNVTNDGGSSITDRGVCWSINPEPTVKDSCDHKGAWAGNIESNIKGLVANTTYYLRAYAKNSAGTAYGNTISFTTLAALLPEIKGTYPSNITQTTALSGGEITSDGGSPVIVRGICWSTVENPTIADSKTADGNGVGTFSSSLTGLTRSTTYYVRVYATNIVGTAYSSQMVVRTVNSTVSDIDGNVYATMIIGTQEWMSENLKVIHYLNGDPIPNVTGIDPWQNAPWDYTTTGAWCSYNNDIANKNTYGLLYNSYAVTDSRGICPIGWHVPSDAEWTILTNYLGGADIAGYKMKGVGDGIVADNSSGFSGLLGGFHQVYTNVPFSSKGLVCFFWTASYLELNNIYYGIGLGKSDKAIVKRQFYSSSGLSVRCLKDN